GRRTVGLAPDEGRRTDGVVPEPGPYGVDDGLDLRRPLRRAGTGPIPEQRALLGGALGQIAGGDAEQADPPGDVDLLAQAEGQFGDLGRPVERLREGGRAGDGPEVGEAHL